jgi:hypothetical protein
MNAIRPVLKVTSVLGLAAVLLGVLTAPASAGLFGRRTVVVGGPTYVVPAPAPMVYAAPVATTVVQTPATAYYAPAVVPTAPVPATYAAPAVMENPVPASYVAPMYAAPVAPVYAAPYAPARVVYPRRVYRYGY